MLFSALLSTALSAPAITVPTGRITFYYHGSTDYSCFYEGSTIGSTSAVIGTAFKMSTANWRGHTDRAPPRIISETNQNYQIEIPALEDDDAYYLLSLFGRDLNANFRPGTWNAKITFVNNMSGEPLKKFRLTPAVPTVALYSYSSPVLAEAFKRYPLC